MPAFFRWCVSLDETLRAQAPGGVGKLRIRPGLLRRSLGTGRLAGLAAQRSEPAVQRGNHLRMGGRGSSASPVFAAATPARVA